MAIHRVSKGDTLRKIAELYYLDGKAENALGAANRLKKGAPLEPGTELYLPARLMGLDSVTERQAMSATAVLALFELRSDLLFVRVQEELLGKTANSTVTLSGKWLYVASDGEVVVRVEAPLEGEWRVQNTLFGGQHYACDEKVTLLAGRAYRFLVSPYPLTPKAQRYFAEHAKDFWDSERKRGKPSEIQANEWTILVRDAYQWVLDAHELLYLPALESYRRWVADHADQLFIASTLKHLVESKDPRWYSGGADPLDIADDLNPGEPNKYITNVYLKGLDEQRLKAERAMAKAAHIVSSQEHRTLELSALDEGGAPLKTTVLMWAAALEFANETQPGRRLLYTLAEETQRFPIAHLFASSPPANSLEFSQFRYLSNAAIAIIKDLAPAWLELNQAKSARTKLMELAEFISLAAGERVTVVEKSFDAMHDNLMKGV